VSGRCRKTMQRERSGAVSGRCSKTMERERSTKREVTERERSGERGLQKWLERGAAFSPLTFRSHALVINDSSIQHIFSSFHRKEIVIAFSKRRGTELK